MLARLTHSYLGGDDMYCSVYNRCTTWWAYRVRGPSTLVATHGLYFWMLYMCSYVLHTCAYTNVVVVVMLRHCNGIYIYVGSILFHLQVYSLLWATRCLRDCQVPTGAEFAPVLVLSGGVSWWVKVFFRHIGCFMRCRKEFLDTNKKTNYITRLETAKRIY
jgi:hypothetical protein